MDQWRWRLLIRIPSSVQQKDIQAAQKIILEKKGLDTSAVKRISWKEGDRIQTLHVGPYDQVGQIYNKLKSYAEKNDLQLAEPAHEIYISDPRRTSPDKLKTIVTMPVKKRAHSDRNLC